MAADPPPSPYGGRDACRRDAPDRRIHRDSAAASVRRGVGSWASGRFSHRNRIAASGDINSRLCYGPWNRLRIVQILVTEGEQPVSELARRLRISQPLMSWHLRRLRRAGIVRMERVGREVRCSFDREKFADLNAHGFRLLMNRAEAQA